MKLLLILFTFSLLLSKASGEVINKKIDNLFDTIGIQKFKESIQRIKSFKTIEEIDELDYELRKYFENINFWYYFDESTYSDGLKTKLRVSFSPKEIDYIAKVFRKPFNLKVLNAMVLDRDIFKFNHNVLMTGFIVAPLAKSRHILIKNLYILHGMVLQNESIKDKLEDYVKSGVTTIGIINKKNGEKLFINPIDLKGRFENTEEFIIGYLGMDLKAFRHYELREYIRKMKGKVLQKFLHIYTNYHFLYLTKYLDKVQQDKLNAIKVLTSKSKRH